MGTFYREETYQISGYRRGNYRRPAPLSRRIWGSEENCGAKLSVDRKLSGGLEAQRKGSPCFRDREGKNWVPIPKATVLIEEDDRLVVYGPHKILKELLKTPTTLAKFDTNSVED